MLSVGDRVTSWLTFEEADRLALSADLVQVIRGTARPLPEWPGAEPQRHPTQVDFDGGAVYWDAPEPVAGAVEIAGEVVWNTIDAPPGFPETSGLVRRLRMEWQEMDGERRYEDVAATYVPTRELGPPDPEVEAAALRQVPQASTTQNRWTGVLVDLELTAD